MNPATGLWTCFACGAKGNWLQFTTLAGDPIGDAYLEPAKIDFTIYDAIRAKLRRAITAGHHPGLLAYCEGRGITAETLDAWRVSSCGPFSIRVPLYARDDAGRWRIANARIRRVLGETDGARDWFETKGGPTHLAMGNHLLGQEPRAWKRGRPSWADEWIATGSEGPAEAPVDPGLETRVVHNVRRVLIVEGQWDSMTAYQLGIPNVLSLPNGAASVDASGLLRYVPDGAEVWVATDMDDAGNRAAEALYAQLGSAVRRLRLPVKDLNDWLKSDPLLTAEAVLATVDGDAASTPKPTSLRELVRKPKRKAEAPTFIETPWPQLTRRLGGGFRLPGTSGLIAASGVGKTTLVNQFLAHAAQYGATCGVISLEGTRDEVVEKLVRQVRGWTKLPDEDLDPILDRIRVSPLEGKAVSWKEVAAEARSLALAGASLLVVDNLDYITPPTMQGNEIKMTAYAAIQEVCRDVGAHAIMVWQPAKIDLTTKVTSGVQKGLSKALQDADVYLNLNRLGLARVLEVEKARVDDVEAGLSRLTLKYAADTGCLHETESQAPLDVLNPGADVPTL